MATQSSQLIENLNLIYNEKLAQKTVLETTSDDFLLYHTYIAALKPSGYTSILSNGQVDVSSYKYAYVSVDGGGIVPVGSYTITTNGEYDIYNYATAVVEVDSSIPEGYVLPSGNIDLIQNGMVDVKQYAYATVSMPVPTGTVNITENGTAIDVSQYASANVAVPVPSGYVLPSGILEINENVIAADCSSYQYVTVDVEGGGSGSSSDPWYDYIITADMIENEETTADYVMSTISDNWSYDYNDDGEGTVSFNVSWDETFKLDVDGNWVDKIVRVEIDGDPHEIVSVGTNINTAIEDDESIYGNIYPILENATLTASEDPSEDGYDYLLVGDLYAWNLLDNCEEVQQIEESGFYPNNGALGFYFSAGAQQLEEKAVFFTNTDSLSQVEQIGLPWNFATESLNGSYVPYVIEAAPYYTCPDGPQAEELNYLWVSTWLADNGIMGNETLDDFVIGCCNMKNDYNALTNVKFNSQQDAATLDPNADGVLYKLEFMTDFNPNLDPNSEPYDNIYDEVNINSNSNLIDFSESGHKLILIPISIGDTNIFFRYEGDSTVNHAPIIKIYNGWTGRMLVEDEDFTIVSSWS